MTIPARAYFEGQTFDPDLDGDRLLTQMQRVVRAVAGGRWWTLAALAATVGGTEAAVSARLRDMRKPRFGRHRVDRRRVSGGLWEYRVLPPLPAGQMDMFT